MQQDDKAGKTWSGRFAEPLDALTQRFNASVDFDRRLAEFDIVVQAFKMGACDYIRKPFNLDVLLTTIEDALRKKDLERQFDDYRTNLEKR